MTNREAIEVLRDWEFKSGDYGTCKDDKWLTHGYEFCCDDWSDEE